jgi:cytochrome b involved in lipid metabolism
MVPSPSPSEVQSLAQFPPESNSFAKDKKEILIDGRYYDVSLWVKAHPGGKVINYYTESGEDASIAFQQFHNRSIVKVEKIKESLTSRIPSSDSERKSANNLSWMRDIISSHN